jgi:hypothetical protein
VASPRRAGVVGAGLYPCDRKRGDYHPASVSHSIIIIKSERSYLSMKTLIEVHTEGKYFVAVDLLTNVADHGRYGLEGL